MKLFHKKFKLETQKVYIKDSNGKLYELPGRVHGLLAIIDAVGHHRILHRPTGAVLMTQCYPTGEKAELALRQVSKMMNWEFTEFPKGPASHQLFDGLLKIATTIGPCQVHLIPDALRAGLKVEQVRVH